MRHDDTYSDLLWGQKWIPGLYFAWYYIVSAGNKYDKSFVPCKLLEGLLESPKPCRIPALLSFKFGVFFFRRGDSIPASEKIIDALVGVLLNQIHHPLETVSAITWFYEGTP